MGRVDNRRDRFKHRAKKLDRELLERGKEPEEEEVDKDRFVHKTVSNNNAYYHIVCDECGEEISSFDKALVKKKYTEHIAKSRVYRTLYPPEQNEAAVDEPIDEYYDDFLEQYVRMSCSKEGDEWVCTCGNDGTVIEAKSQVDAWAAMTLHLSNSPEDIDLIERVAQRRLNMDREQQERVDKNNFTSGETGAQVYHMQYRNRAKWDTLPSDPDVSRVSEPQHKPGEDYYFLNRKRRGYKHRHNGSPKTMRNYPSDRERRFMGKGVDDNKADIVPQSSVPQRTHDKKNYMYRLIRNKKGRNMKRQNTDTNQKIYGIDDAATFARS